MLQVSRKKIPEVMKKMNLLEIVLMSRTKRKVVPVIMMREAMIQLVMMRTARMMIWAELIQLARTMMQ